jgi:branched-subunit amino acid transport protein
MTGQAQLWILLLAMGAVTYASRIVMIALLGRIAMPDLVRRALRYVPPAVLSAIIAPALLRPAGPWDLSLGNERLLAGLAATLVAWRTRNIVLTVVAGMGLMWLLGAL